MGKPFRTLIAINHLNIHCNINASNLQSYKELNALQYWWDVVKLLMKLTKLFVFAVCKNVTLLSMPRHDVLLVMSFQYTQRLVNILSKLLSYQLLTVLTRT